MKTILATIVNYKVRGFCKLFMYRGFVRDLENINISDQLYNPQNNVKNNSTFQLKNIINKDADEKYYHIKYERF